MNILTPDEVAEILKVPRRTVICLCARGDLPGARKAGRCWRVPESAIARFFAAPEQDDQELEPLDEPRRAPASTAVHDKPAPTTAARAPGKAASRAHRRPGIPDPATDRAGFLRVLRGDAPRRKVAGR